jgi:hypothetical protein
MTVVSAEEEKQRWMHAQRSVKTACALEKKGAFFLAQHALVIAFDSLLELVQVGVQGIVAEEDVSTCQSILDRSQSDLIEQFNSGSQLSNDCLCLQVFSTILFVPVDSVPIGIAMFYNACIFVQLFDEPHHMVNLETMDRSKCLWIHALFLNRLGNTRRGLEFMDSALEYTNGLAIRVMREEFVTMTSYDRSDQMVRMSRQESSFRAIIEESNLGGSWLTKCYAYLGCIELMNGRFSGHVTLGRMEENRAVTRSNGLPELSDDTDLCNWVSGMNMVSESPEQASPPRFLYRYCCVKCHTNKSVLRMCGKCNVVLYCSVECQKSVCVIVVLTRNALLSHTMKLTLSCL